MFQRKRAFDKPPKRKSSAVYCSFQVQISIWTLAKFNSIVIESSKAKRFSNCQKVLPKKVFLNEFVFSPKKYFLKLLLELPKIFSKILVNSLNLLDMLDCFILIFGDF